MAFGQMVHLRAGVNPAMASAAKKIAGRNAFISYDLSKADVIVSLESDFLNSGPAAMVYARQFGRSAGLESGETPIPLVRHRIRSFGQRISRGSSLLQLKAARLRRLRTSLRKPAELQLRLQPKETLQPG